jgi:hypothetical protein
MGEMKSKYESRLSRRRLRFAVMLASGLLLTALPTFSQSCALCYTQAASSGRQMIEALRSGILILIIPPTLGTIAFLFIVHHKRNQIRRTDADGPRLGW